MRAISKLRLEFTRLTTYIVEDNVNNINQLQHLWTQWHQINNRCISWGFFFSFYKMIFSVKKIVHTFIDPKQRNNDIDTTRFSFENRSTIVFTKQFEQISNLRGSLQSITLRIRSSHNHRKLPRHK